jgi:hypothetical protein
MKARKAFHKVDISKTPRLRDRKQTKRQSKHNSPRSCPEQAGKSEERNKRQGRISILSKYKSVAESTSTIMRITYTHRKGEGMNGPFANKKSYEREMPIPRTSADAFVSCNMLMPRKKGRRLWSICRCTCWCCRSVSCCFLPDISHFDLRRKHEVAGFS